MSLPLSVALDQLLSVQKTAEASAQLNWKWCSQKLFSLSATLYIDLPSPANQVTDVPIRYVQGCVNRDMRVFTFVTRRPTLSGVLTSVVPSKNDDDEQESDPKMVRGVKGVMSKFFV